MRYLDGKPFSAPVSNGKLTDAEWERMVGPKPGKRVENAENRPKAENRKRCHICKEAPVDCQCFNEVTPGK